MRPLTRCVPSTSCGDPLANPHSRNQPVDTESTGRRSRTSTPCRAPSWASSRGAAAGKRAEWDPVNQRIRTQMLVDELLAEHAALRLQLDICQNFIAQRASVPDGGGRAGTVQCKWLFVSLTVSASTSSGSAPAAPAATWWLRSRANVVEVVLDLGGRVAAGRRLALDDDQIGSRSRLRLPLCGRGGGRRLPVARGCGRDRLPRRPVR